MAWPSVVGELGIGGRSPVAHGDLVRQLGVAAVASVEDVVLHHEEDVEEYGEETEAELGRVAEYRTPVVCAQQTPTNVSLQCTLPTVNVMHLATTHITCI